MSTEKKPFFTEQVTSKEVPSDKSRESLRIPVDTESTRESLPRGQELLELPNAALNKLVFDTSVEDPKILEDAMRDLAVELTDWAPTKMHPNWLTNPSAHRFDVLAAIPPIGAADYDRETPYCLNIFRDLVKLDTQKQRLEAKLRRENLDKTDLSEVEEEDIEDPETEITPPHIQQRLHSRAQKPSPRRGLLGRIFSPLGAAVMFMFGLQSHDGDESAPQLSSTPHSERATTADHELRTTDSDLQATDSELLSTSYNLPATATELRTHVVEKGDRLWDIAKQEISDQKGIALTRVHNADILARVKELKTLNNISDATKLEVGTVLTLDAPPERTTTADHELRTTDSDLQATSYQLQPTDSELPSTGYNLPATSSELRTHDASAIEGPEHAFRTISRRGDTAWAHADSMLREANVKPTIVRRQLVAALMLAESGNLNAYRLKIGQKLSTQNARKAIEALQKRKQPADIARQFGLRWPPRGL